MRCAKTPEHTKVYGEWRQGLLPRLPSVMEPAAPAQTKRQCAAKAVQRWQPIGREQSQVAASATLMAELPETLQRQDSLDRSAALSLDNIRQSLIRQEDTIIFSLIERAQFAANPPVYEAGAIPVPGYGRERSLLDYLLHETEQTHGKIRRYTSPDEHAFFPEDLPALVIPPLFYDEVLAPYSREININDKIMSLYINHLVPGIAEPGVDNNFGSSACYDVLALQALSKRIHYGKFVAEAKFRAQPDEYSRLIRMGDREGLMALLTNEAVEAKVVERVRRKAAIYGQDISLEGEHHCHCDGSAEHSQTGECAPGVSYKVEPEIIAELYRRWVMPLTKEVQIEYLLRRLEAPEIPPPMPW